MPRSIAAILVACECVVPTPVRPTGAARELRGLMSWRNSKYRTPSPPGSGRGPAPLTQPIATVANLPPILAEPEALRQPPNRPAIAAAVPVPREAMFLGGRALAPIDEYAFLVGRLIDYPTLVRATLLSRDWNASIHNALVTLGWVAEADYARALAEPLQLDIAARRVLQVLSPSIRPRYAGVLPAVEVATGRRLLVVSATALSPRGLAGLVEGQRRLGIEVVLATTAEVEALLIAPHRTGLLDRAVLGLSRHDAALSATSPTARWQQVALLAVLSATVFAFSINPSAAIPAALALLTVPFLMVTGLRLLAMRELITAKPTANATARLPDDALPLYSILVPLYDEVEVLPELVRWLTALDYPASRLEVLLLLEEHDVRTRTAAAALDLPGHVRVIVVPPGMPRTKPRALNYALSLVRGAFVVVYDAEDHPEPSQLREALARFMRGGQNLACVQARLNTYNPSQSFYTRQFTLEYTVLFDAILPALERLRLPLPLGGTSNHFPTSLLRRAGAWDPFNVTEDADLGIRLARLGYATATLASTTWEEAPVSRGNWISQRTRWLKGWMQTYLVHMRQPRRVFRELGLRGFLGLQLLMGAILMAVLAHPLIYGLMIAAATTGQLFEPPETAIGQAFWWLAVTHFSLGLITSVGAAAYATVKRGRPSLALWALAMPLYWLMISFAGYRALLQLLRQPYLWEKTRHGQSNR